MLVTGASLLSEGVLTDLRVRAAAEAGPFVDPRVLRAVQGWWRHDMCEWAAAVTGREHVTDLNRLPWADWVLLARAHQLEPDPPPPPRLTARRAELQAAEDAQRAVETARQQAQDNEWAALRNALPVPVSIAHNYSSRHHYENYVQGADHIVVWADLNVGRLHRNAQDALCKTPSRSRHLLLANAELERRDQEDGRERARPSCRRCIYTAYQLAGREPNGMLP